MEPLTVILWTLLLLLWVFVSESIVCLHLILSCIFFTSKPLQSGLSVCHSRVYQGLTVSLNIFYSLLPPALPAVFSSAPLSLNQTRFLNLSFSFLSFLPSHRTSHLTLFPPSKFILKVCTNFSNFNLCDFYRSRQTRIGPCLHWRANIFWKKHKKRENHMFWMSGDLTKLNDWVLWESLSAEMKSSANPDVLRKQ